MSKHKPALRDYRRNMGGNRAAFFGTVIIHGMAAGLLFTDPTVRDLPSLPVYNVQLVAAPRPEPQARPAPEAVERPAPQPQPVRRPPRRPSVAEASPPPDTKVDKEPAPRTAPEAEPAMSEAAGGLPRSSGNSLDQWEALREKAIKRAQRKAKRSGLDVEGAGKVAEEEFDGKNPRPAEGDQPAATPEVAAQEASWCLGSCLDSTHRPNSMDIPFVLKTDAPASIPNHW